MKIEIVRTTSEFENIRDEWNSLLEESDSRSIFLTWEWLYYWWIHFKKHKKLFILLVRDAQSGALAGIAPFCTEQAAFLRFLKINRIKFLGSEKVGSDFLDIVMRRGQEPGVLDTIHQFLDAHDSEWDVIEMGDIDEQSRVIEYVSRNASRYFKVYQSTASICPYISLPQKYEELVRSLKPNMRRSLLGKTKKLEANVPVRLRSDTSRESVRDLIDTLFLLHSDRFSSKRRKSSFDNQEMKEFHYDVASRFLEKGWLKLYFLDAEQELIASLYAFKYRNRLFYYQSGFDPRWSKWGPGTVLMGYCIRDSIREGADEFHYLRGTEDYKSRWTETIKRTRNIVLINSTVKAVCYDLCAEALKRTKNVLKRFHFEF